MYIFISYSIVVQLINLCDTEFETEVVWRVLNPRSSSQFFSRKIEQITKILILQNFTRCACLVCDESSKLGMIICNGKLLYYLLFKCYRINNKFNTEHWLPTL